LLSVGAVQDSVELNEQERTPHTHTRFSIDFLVGTDGGGLQPEADHCLIYHRTDTEAAAAVSDSTDTSPPKELSADDEDIAAIQIMQAEHHGQGLQVSIADETCVGPGSSPVAAAT
jgi:predicted ATPase